MNFSERLIVKPGSKVRLSDFDPSRTKPFKDKKQAQKVFEKNLSKIDDLQNLLYAEGRRSLLIVLQGMDAAGKDGTIRHVMTGMNPQGCHVTSFKAPSAEEMSHDFLWRIHKALPSRGQIGIFNRSHYEDVLIVRVHDLVPQSQWSQRYDQINQFEKTLSENGTTILKFFLHISKEEQRSRFLQRLQDPARNWKVSPDDFKERPFWNHYQAAYDAVLSKCSTPWAPWFIIPADRKWFRNLAVAKIIEETLRGMNLKFPKPKADLSTIKFK